MMNATNASTRDEVSLDSLVAGVVDEFRERLKGGEQPDIEEYAVRYPEAAVLLRKVLATMQFLEASLPGAGAASTTDDAPLSGTLGDFRLLREVGRGGMGIVYEAEQISLGRRVALKVLPFAATLDPRQLQRFHNEARAAASLRHQHIVPVYAVGQERGIHFFAMQFIDGQTMADLIKQHKHGATPVTVNESTVSGGANTPVCPPSEPAADTEPVAGKSTGPIARDAAFFRRAAEWGIQAAEGLEHAHSLGIVHRDIKPGNLMIDAHGQLWIADFGLARRAADSDLTMSGDLLGTLRYMSPEQALAKHDLVDHRSDIYSLGATLYELLTLQAAVEGNDRQEILRQITQVDGKNLRRWDRRIPADLETIVLKSLAKEPEGRYATVKELAEDLRRYLANEPIRARRPTLRQHAFKWAQRHQPLLTSTFLLLLVGVVALAVMLSIVSSALDDRELALQHQIAAVREKENALIEKNDALKQKDVALGLAKEKEAEAIKNAEDAQREWVNADKNFLAAVRTSSTILKYAKVLRLEGKHDEARDVAGRGSQLLISLADSLMRPSPHAAAIKQLTWEKLKEYMACIDLCRDLGRYDVAYQVATKAIDVAMIFETDPLKNDARLKTTIALFFERKGRLALEVGNAREAEIAFQEAEFRWRKIGTDEPGLLEVGEENANRMAWKKAQARLNAQKYKEAEDAFKKALRKADGLPNALFPNDSFWIHHGLASIFWESGEWNPAKGEFEKALGILNKHKRMEKPLIEFLLTCPDERLRDPARALKLLNAEKSTTWLPLAHYRVGNYQVASDTPQLPDWSDSPVEQVVLSLINAMANARMGKTDQAKKKCQETLTRIDAEKMQHVLIRQFLREAQQLPGLNEVIPHMDTLAPKERK